MNAPVKKEAAAKRGRPVLFDRETTLHEAMKLFWERGYEGTSFDQLIEAMGISASTFYNSFFSKERLYKEASEYYVNGPTKWFRDILDGPTDTRESFDLLVKETAKQYTSKKLPSGCMISLAGTHVPPGMSSIRDMFVEYRAYSERLLVDRLRKGVEAGELPKDSNLVELAGYFGTIFRGMAVQARDGKPREHLLAIGRLAMNAWPSKD